MDSIKTMAEEALTLISISKNQSQAIAVNRKRPDWLPAELQGRYNETDLEYDPYCLRIFQNLEAAKRENFPRETMRIWFMEFIKRGWTKKMVLARYNALIAKPIFGKENLEFSDWVSAVPVYAEDEINILVNRKVESIIARGNYLKNKQVELTEEDKKAVETAVAMDIAFNYSTTKLDLIENLKKIRKEEKLKGTK